MLRAADAASIWAVLSDYVGPVGVTARCADDIEREFDSVDALTGYDNPLPRAIRSLSFRARSKDRETSASLRLGGGLSSTIDLDIEGPEPSVLNIRDRLSEVFGEIRPWYSPMSRVDFFFVVGAIFFFFVLVLTAMSGGAKSEKTLSFFQALRSATVVLGFLAGIGLVIWCLNRLRDRFFPVATFALGRGQERYEFDEKIRWVVIVGFLVSVFSSLVVAFLLPTA